MNLIKITNSESEYFSFFKEVYLNSFPVDERRPLCNIEEMIKTHTPFSLYIIEKDNQSIGFISTWQLENFTYAEHFAIHEKYRSMKYGSVAMSTLLNSCKLPLILEVEPPVDEVAIKRVKFYERLGLKISDYDYIQPPYAPNQLSLHLKLMEYGGDLIFINPKMVEEILHTEVYGV